LALKIAEEVPLAPLEVTFKRPREDVIDAFEPVMLLDVMVVAIP
jgi:hypothetical protein